MDAKVEGSSPSSHPKPLSNAPSHILLPVERGPGNWPIDKEAAFVECHQKLEQARKEAEHWRDNHKTLRKELEKLRSAKGAYNAKVRLALFAVLRVDLDLEDPEQAVAVKEIVSTLEHAEAEVQRLNQVNADKRCKYIWRATRFIPADVESVIKTER